MGAQKWPSESRGVKKIRILIPALGGKQKKCDPHRARGADFWDGAEKWPSEPGGVKKTENLIPTLGGKQKKF
mgnify:CR=1 FL=1